MPNRHRQQVYVRVCQVYGRVVRTVDISQLFQVVTEWKEVSLHGLSVVVKVAPDRLRLLGCHLHVYTSTVCAAVLRATGRPATSTLGLVWCLCEWPGRLGTDDVLIK